MIRRNIENGRLPGLLVTVMWVVPLVGVPLPALVFGLIVAACVGACSGWLFARLWR